MWEGAPDGERGRRTFCAALARPAEAGTVRGADGLRGGGAVDGPRSLGAWRTRAAAILARPHHPARAGRLGPSAHIRDLTRGRTGRHHRGAPAVAGRVDPYELRQDPEA